MDLGPAAHHRWLRSWLQSNVDDSYANFQVNAFDELERPDDATQRLAQMIIQAKCNPDSLRRLLSRVGWMNSPARLAPSKRPQGRHGDFGEVLAIGLLDVFAGLQVPVVKLRVQMDPEQSLHGCDVVAFDIEEIGGRLVLQDLEFVEVKCRTTRDKQQARKAHDQLDADRVTQFTDTLEFLHQRLDELGHHDVLDAFEEYLARRDDGPNGAYRIVLVFDSGAWTGDELNEIPDGDALCGPLTVDVVLVDDLKDLIDGSWLAITPDLLEVT